MGLCPTHVSKLLVPPKHYRVPSSMHKMRLFSSLGMKICVQTHKRKGCVPVDKICFFISFILPRMFSHTRNDYCYSSSLGHQQRTSRIVQSSEGMFLPYHKWRRLSFSCPHACRWRGDQERILVALLEFRLPATMDDAIPQLSAARKFEVYMLAAGPFFLYYMPDIC